MNVTTRMHPLLLVPPALAVALALDQGGFDPSAWVWSGALAAWAAGMAAVLWRDLRLSRSARAWLVSACALLAWVALSWVWSDRRAQTVLELRRTTVYAAAVLALVVLARRGTGRHLLVLTHVATTGVVIYALTRYLTETRTVDTFEGTLLAQPLGYANALGTLAAVGLVLGIGIAAQTPAAIGRAAAAATAPVLATALALTSSRGAVVAIGVGLVATMACADDPAPFLRTALIVAPASALAAVAAATSRLDDASAEPYTHAGWIVGGAAVACAIATAIVAARVRPVAQSRRHVPRRALAAALVIGVVAAGVASGLTEPRTSLWGVALHQFEKHVLAGSGAGTFALAWARSGLIENRGGALDAHSLYLETLAELGLGGFVLLLVFLALPLVHARRAPVAAGAYVVVLLHAGLDWDWEMPAVFLVGLCCAAALASEAEPARPVAGRGRATIVLLAIALGAVSIAGARSSSEPGVAPRLPAAVLAGRAVRLPVPVALPVLRLRSGLGGAGREGVAVAEVRLDGAIRHGDSHPRMLLRVRAVTELHAVLLARGPVLAA
jgi:O-antigen ligase